MDKAGVLTEKQKVWDGRDLFFPLSMYGNESMGCHRCARFHSGQLPICGTESEIDAASACWINRAEFALVQFHTCQVVKNKCQLYRRGLEEGVSPRSFSSYVLYVSFNQIRIHLHIFYLPLFLIRVMKVIQDFHEWDRGRNTPWSAHPCNTGHTHHSITHSRKICSPHSASCPKT